MSRANVEARSRPYAVPSANDDQKYSRPSGRSKDERDKRTEAERDCDRISYSDSWRRLGGVTQVITPFDNLPLLHNRLTHSEKVASVAKAVADRLLYDREHWPLMNRLGGFDVDICVAAGLAHDLGHPPFGHVGEEVLDKTARDEWSLWDGFEGNAQSLRVVSIGKIRSLKYEGLDLTFGTLAAISKYPWRREATVQHGHEERLLTDARYRRHWRKFNAYEPQSDLLASARDYLDGAVGDATQSLEASVMDVADDITYAIHDLEDFFVSGILNISAIRGDLDEYRESNGQRGPFVSLAKKLGDDYPGWFDEERLIAAVGKVESQLKLGFSSRKVDAHTFSAVARGQGSAMIDRYVEAIILQEEPLWADGPHIGLEQAKWHEVQVLKEITRSYVVQRPDIALLQRGQQRALEEFLRLLRHWSEQDQQRLPQRLVYELTLAEEQQAKPPKVEVGYSKEKSAPRGPKERAIIDYICSLTDAECLQVYYNLSGIHIHRPGVAAF